MSLPSRVSTNCLYLLLPILVAIFALYRQHDHHDLSHARLERPTAHVLPFAPLLHRPSRAAPPAPRPDLTMAWRCTGSSNADLIANLFRASLITSPSVRTAMAAVDRAHYCPHVAAAYEDSPQPIGHGATISAPHMHASAAESLLPFVLAAEDAEGRDRGVVQNAAGAMAGADKSRGRGRRVLDVGSGSGYLVHVFANLVPDHPESKVVGIDHIQPLVDLARSNMRKSEGGRRMLESGRVEIVKGDGRRGWAEGGPYDAIHVGAAASEIHEELVQQLNAPGRMFIPVEDARGGGGGFWGGGNQYIWVVDKDVNGKVTRKRTMGVRYVPLTDAPRT